MPRSLPVGFTIEGLRETYSSGAGLGLDSGLPDWLRFLSGVVKVLLARRALGLDDGSLRPAIFFLSEPVADYGSTSRSTTFIQGHVEVNGSIWFMNEEARRGEGVVHDCSAEELLDLARRNAELATCPTVLFIPDAPQSPIVFFQGGLANESELSADYELMDVVSAPLARVNEAITRLHEDVLESPNGVFGSFAIWEDAARYQPIRHAERAIQAQVRATLVNAIPSIHAAEEEMTAAGRFDIGLVQIEGNRKVYHGLLELKVLRKGKNASVILKEGLKQAYNYGTEVGATWSELCAFDMRDTGPDADPFTGLHPVASSFGVAARSWYLFPTVELLRNHRSKTRLEASENED